MNSLRLLLGAVVGVGGALASYLLATKIGGFSTLILGPIAGSILAVIVGAGGLAVTAAVVHSILRTARHTAPR